VVRFHDQLFSGSGDRVVLQADRVPSFVVPSCQPSSTAVTDKTVSFVMHIFDKNLNYCCVKCTVRPKTAASGTESVSEGISMKQHMNQSCIPPAETTYGISICCNNCHKMFMHTHHLVLCHLQPFKVVCQLSVHPSIGSEDEPILTTLPCCHPNDAVICVQIVDKFGRTSYMKQLLASQPDAASGM